MLKNNEVLKGNYFLVSKKLKIQIISFVPFLALFFRLKVSSMSLFSEISQTCYSSSESAQEERRIRTAILAQATNPFFALQTFN